MKLTIPGAMAVLDSGEVCVDGVIGPGHVSAVTGSGVWSFLPSKYGIPIAICGFESLDLLTGICALLDMIEHGECRLVNTYARAVKPGGNLLAQKTVEEVFSIVNAEWRGFGVLPASGLELRANYSRFDAVLRFGLERVPSRSHPLCRCGDVLRAVCEPHECPAFGLACTPGKPLGPCMVSAEGACAAYWTYGESTSSI
jgi:hydrogenase expression/formation protein HypD